MKRRTENDISESLYKEEEMVIGWTIISIEEFKQLKKKNRLIANTKLVNANIEGWENAYKFMVDELSVYDNKPDIRDLVYPRWIYTQYEGETNMLFSPLSVIHGNKAGRYILMKVKFDDNRVLLSSEDEWVLPLNNVYIPKTEKDDKENATTEEKIASWKQVFDLEHAYVYTRPMRKDWTIQGVVWVINKEDVDYVYEVEIRTEDIVEGFVKDELLIKDRIIKMNNIDDMKVR